jgi:DNA-binding NarL/FixJ family response regulator
MNKITVLVVDNHRLFRETMSFFLNSYQEFQVIGDTSDAEEALKLAGSMQPNIAIIDINMSPVNGFELTEKMISASPRTRILTVSVFAIPAYLKKIFAAGAQGYVTKNSPPAELREAIIALNEGRQFICHEMKLLLMSKKVKSKEAAIARLTYSELRVISMIRQGFSTSEIADNLKISSKTVAAHRYRVSKKLGINKITELIDYIDTVGL